MEMIEGFRAGLAVKKVSAGIDESINIVSELPSLTFSKESSCDEGSDIPLRSFHNSYVGFVKASLSADSLNDDARNLKRAALVSKTILDHKYNLTPTTDLVNAENP